MMILDSGLLSWATLYFFTLNVIAKFPPLRHYWYLEPIYKRVRKTQYIPNNSLQPVAFWKLKFHPKMCFESSLTDCVTTTRNTCAVSHYPNILIFQCISYLHQTVYSAWSITFTDTPPPTTLCLCIHGGTN